MKKLGAAVEFLLTQVIRPLLIFILLSIFISGLMKNADARFVGVYVTSVGFIFYYLARNPGIINYTLFAEIAADEPPEPDAPTTKDVRALQEAVFALDNEHIIASEGYAKYHQKKTEWMKSLAEVGNFEIRLTGLLMFAAILALPVAGLIAVTAAELLGASGSSL